MQNQPQSQNQVFEYKFGPQNQKWAIYNGQWQNGKTHGIGSFEASINNIHIIYQGNWKEGKMNDNQGKLIINNQSYIGSIQNNLLTGLGKLYYENGNLALEGQFQNGQIVHGKQYFQNNDKFEGSFQNGQYSNGMYTFANGDAYTGPLDKGQMNGQGTMKYQNGDFCKGTWQNNLLNGDAEFTFSDQSQYIGKFKDGLMEDPQGKYIFPSGDMWIGKFEKGQMIPQSGGIFQSPKNNFSYQGTLSENFSFSQGQFTYHDGSQIAGKWEQYKLEIEALQDGEDFVEKQIPTEVGTRQGIFIQQINQQQQKLKYKNNLITERL